jgi:drug/metabolite transporter (DMT)-like permease
MIAESRPPHAAPSTQHAALRVHGALTLVAILFSSNYIISKLAMNSFSPLTFAYLRVLGAAIVLNAILVLSGGPPPRRPRAGEDAGAPLSGELGRLTLYSILGVALNQTLFLAGLALTSAHVAAILITSIPIFALGAAMIMGRERGTPAKIGGIALAGIGALLVVGAEGFQGAFRSLIGDLLILANSLSFALYLVLSKPMMAHLSARHVIGRMFAIAAVLMLPIAAWPMATESWSAVPQSAWIALLLVIAGPTVAAYLLNAWALTHAESSLVAAYTYLQPVITTILAALFLGERIRPVAILAGVLIVTGVYVSGRRVV